MIWDYLSQGGHEHWGELSKGTVVQGRFKVVSCNILYIIRPEAKIDVGKLM